MDEDEIFLAEFLVNILDEAEQDADYPARRFSRNENPFLLSDRTFIKNFRVSKELARYIIEIVTPFVIQPTRASALDTERKVLTALRFLGYGSYQEITGTNVFTTVSQSSVSKCLEEICNALCNPQIFNEWVAFPQNMVELRALRNRFYQKYGFPGVVGCIDCTHVAITRPLVNDPVMPEHIYVNRKNYHSINVQLICDENLKILNVNARFPGSTHDAHIWRESVASTTMEAIYRRNNDDVFFLLGDSGYPLRPWLLTPLRDVEPNSPEQRFNDSLMSIRATIERCNGVLKNRFRCLLKDRVLHYLPRKASKIINTCVVLHNMCLQFNVPEPQIEINPGELGIFQDLADDHVNANDDANARVNLDLAAARRLQLRIIRSHFR